MEEDDDINALTPFAVRLAEDRQVVGIFVAESLEHLAHLVDQCVDPTATEYLRLGAGGVYVAESIRAQWPARELQAPDGEVIDIKPDDKNPLKGAILDDYWSSDMDEGDWLPLTWT